MSVNRCKTCGVPLDEIPFDDCEEHKAYEASQPLIELTFEELSDIAWDEAMQDMFDNR